MTEEEDKPKENLPTPPDLGGANIAAKKEKPLSSYLLFLLLVLVCMGKAGGGSLNKTPIFSMSPDLYSAPL